MARLSLITWSTRSNLTPRRIRLWQAIGHRVTFRVVITTRVIVTIFVNLAFLALPSILIRLPWVHRPWLTVITHIGSPQVLRLVPIMSASLFTGDVIRLAVLLLNAPERLYSEWVVKLISARNYSSYLYHSVLHPFRPATRLVIVPLRSRFIVILATTVLRLTPTLVPFLSQSFSFTLESFYLFLEILRHVKVLVALVLVAEDYFGLGPWLASVNWVGADVVGDIRDRFVVSPSFSGGDFEVIYAIRFTLRCVVEVLMPLRLVSFDLALLPQSRLLSLFLFLLLR